MVRVVVRPWRTRPPAHPSAVRPAQLARLLLQPAGHLTEAERDTREDFLQANPLLAQEYQRKTRVHTRLAERHVGAFEPWLHAAATSDLPACPSLARRVRQDADAILAARTTPWSTGQCAGQICRVKLLKRLG
jgi:transposase